MKKPAFETASTEEQDSAALETFRRWYEEEQQGSADLDPETRHALGTAQAIKAVFHLGQSCGYTQGYNDAQAEFDVGMSNR